MLSKRYLFNKNASTILLASSPRRGFAMPATACETITARSKASSNPAPAADMRKIIASPNDKRDYELVHLENGLEALLISDPETEEAAAAMDCKVGHFQDPAEIPGMAHFCEHMLFLGTNKYPDENSYKEFLAANGGSSNAYTSMENTNYYFNVNRRALGEALDRFSEFFKAPLFTESATNREMNAVDSEFQKNLHSDSWRNFQLLKHTSNPHHPFSKFGTGNLQTLNLTSSNIRDHVLKFYEQNYSSNTMKLACLGKEPIRVLKDMVVDKFSEVKPREIIRPTREGVPVFTPDQMQKIYSIAPVADIRTLEVIWPLPYNINKKYYKEKPASYVSHLLGHEGENSLFFLLKAKGLVNSLSAGTGISASDFSLFSVSMSLTEAGQENMHDILRCLYQYLALLKGDPSGAQQWIFDEISNIAKAKFLFLEKIDPASYTSDLSERLQHYPPEDVLKVNFLYEDFDPLLINNFVNMLSPDNMRINFVSKKVEQYEPKADFLVEPWYQTKYLVQDIPREWIDEFSQLAHTRPVKVGDLIMDYPHANIFVPTNFDIVKSLEEPAAKPAAEEQAQEKEKELPVLPPPKEIQVTDNHKLYYMLDTKFNVPKCTINTLMRLSTDVMQGLRTTCLTAVYTQLVNDSLQSILYSAEVAGLGYSVYVLPFCGIRVTTSGFSHKLDIFTEEVFRHLVNPRTPKSTFEQIKERTLRAYKNSRKNQSYQQADYMVSHILTNPHYHYEEIIEELEKITYEDVKQFIPEILAKMSLETLVHGNFAEQGAVQLVTKVNEILKTPISIPELSLLTPTTTNNNGEKQQQRSIGAPLRPSQMAFYNDLVLPPGTSIYKMKTTNEESKNSAVEFHYQIGKRSLRTKLLTELLSQIIKAPCFDQLRTKEQLGYIVFSGSVLEETNVGFHFIVQSASYSPVHIHNSINSFVNDFKKTLEELPEEEFSNYKNAVKERKLRPSKKLAEDTNKYWFEIATGFHRYTRVQDEVRILEQLTKEQLLDFYTRYICPTTAEKAASIRRLAVLVYGSEHDIVTDKQQQQAGEEGSAAATVAASAPSQEHHQRLHGRGILYIHDIAKFKQTLSAYPRHVNEEEEEEDEDEQSSNVDEKKKQVLSSCE